jgi:hypothetical protein
VSVGEHAAPLVALVDLNPALGHVLYRPLWCWLSTG